MHLRKVLSILGFLPVLGLLVAPLPAIACTGTSLPGTVIDPDADMIFSGTAVRVEDPRNPFDPASASNDAMAWTFAVDEVHRGSVPGRVTVYTERMEASCGYPFELGSRYRVVATGPVHSLHAGLFGGTDRIEPLVEPPPVESAGLPVDVSLLVAIASVLLIAGVAVYLAFTRTEPTDKPVSR